MPTPDPASGMDAPMDAPVDNMRLALLRITRRRGPFCRDPAEHAENVILASVNLARKALGLAPVWNLDDAEMDVPPETEEEREYASD